MTAQVLQFPRREAEAQRVDPGRLDAPDPASGLEPPQDLRAEAAMISGMLLDGNDHADDTPCAAARALEVIEPRHCFSPTHARIAEGIADLRRSRTPVDAVTVARWLDAKGWLAACGGSPYLATLCDATPSIGNVLAHAEIVRDAFEDRELIAACARARVEGYRRRTSEDRAEWRAGVRRELGRLTAPRAKLAGAPIGVAVQEVRAQIDAQRSKVVRGVSWGLAPLDAAFGILAQSEQHVLAGLSEHGKTALGGQIAVEVAATPLDAHGVGEAVYVHSAELKATQFVMRLACSYAGVDASRAKAGLLMPEESEELGRWLGWIESLPIVIDDDPADAKTLARRVREHQHLFATGRARRAPKPGEVAGGLHEKCRLRLVLGDHAQKLARLCSGAGERADTKSQIAAVSHGWLTHIAKGLDVATLLLAQVQRQLLDKERAPKGKVILPASRHLEGASELAQDADTIAIVHQPQLPLIEADEEVPAKWIDVAAIIPGKRRWGGKRGLVRLGYRLGKFSEDLPAAARGEPYFR